MKKIVVVAAVVLAAGFLLACAGTEGSAGPTGPAGPEGPAGPAGAGLEPMTRDLYVRMGEGEIIGGHVEGAGEEIEEIIGEFHRWEPAVLVAFKGDTINLTVENPRGSTHSLEFEDFGVDTESLEARGGIKTVTFTVDEAGVFQFICGLPYEDEDTGVLTDDCDLDHERMVGYLIVLDR